MTWGVGAGLAVEHWVEPKLEPTVHKVLLMPQPLFWVKVLTHLEQKGLLHCSTTNIVVGNNRGGGAGLAMKQ